MDAETQVLSSYANAPRFPAEGIEERIEEINDESLEHEQREAVDTLGNLLHSRAHILRTKLEVLASEIHERLIIRSNNLRRIYTDKVTIYEILRKLNYRAVEHAELSQLYQRRLDLEKERREEDVETWRDVVNVMKDLLMAWEAAEEAKSEVEFLGTVGRRA